MHYLINAGVILAGCLLFYKLLLQKETFYRANRWVLLACLGLSFGLPLVQVPPQWSLREASRVAVEQPAEYPAKSPSGELQTILPAMPATGEVSPPAVVNNQTREDSGPLFTSARVVQWAGWLYWFGVMVFGISFLVQLISLFYKAYSNPVIRDGRFRIVELAGNKAPCSFWNNIFINPEQYDWETYNQIIQHEKVHIEQRHSLDLLLAELVIIFQWFNPFAWQYRRTLESNLEYLTDDQLVNHLQVEPTAYQLSLLKVSAPHFPLNLTTNYNQSLLKKRIAMMNVKKSNLHTAWKYGFLLPLLVLLVSLLNEPVVYAHEPIADKKMNNSPLFTQDIDTEGVWFATIKKDEVIIQFKSDGDDHSTNSTTFALKELGELPRDKAGIFTLTREAGAVQFTGRFEGEQGMGRYRFTASADYADAIRKEGIELRDDKDVMVFFLVNVTRSYVKMLKQNGYTGLERNDVIPMAAMKVDEAYIQSIKKSGLRDLGLRNLVPFKALGITGDYIAEIRNAGYPDVTANQLITFKSQKIDAKYIADIRSATATPGKVPADKAKRPAATDAHVNVDINANSNTHADISANELVSIKSMNIDPVYIQSLKDAGLDNLSNSQLLSMKSLNVTPEYVRELRTAGLTDLRPQEVVGLKAQKITGEYVKGLKAAGFHEFTANDAVSAKAQDVTPEYAKSITALGFKDIKLRQLLSLKAMDITPEFIKGFQDIGYKDVTLQQVQALKGLHVTPALVKEYSSLGFEELRLQDILSAKATGATPAFVTAMKEKGHNLKTLHKYMQLKTIAE